MVLNIHPISFLFDVSVQFSTVSHHVWLFVTPWTVACQGSLSITNSGNLLKLMSIKLVMPSNHLIFCHSLFLLPSIFLIFNESVLPIRGQSIGDSASASGTPMTIQGWFPLGLTDLISLQSKVLSRVFANTTVQKHQFFGAQSSLWSNSYIHTWLLEENTPFTIWTFVGKGTSLLFNTQSLFIIAFLPRSKHLLISWL